MKTRIYVCNVCQVKKKKADNWFKAFKFYQVVKGEKDQEGIQLLPWTAKFPPQCENNSIVNLCSIEHALQWTRKELSMLEEN